MIGGTIDLRHLGTKPVSWRILERIRACHSGRPRKEGTSMLTEPEPALPAGPANPAASTLAGALLSRAGRRVLLVGDAPARQSVVALDPLAQTGIRVRAMMPSTPFGTVNLCSHRWDGALSIVMARQLWASAFAGREVCLLGRKTLRAFRRLCPALDALAESPPFSLAAPTVPDPEGGWARALVWWAPRPSSRNRWWDKPANKSAGEAFFRYVLGRLEFPERPEIPAPVRGMLELVLDDLRRGR